MESDGCGRCTITAESVQLIYRPVGMYSGGQNSTIGPTASEVVTSVSNVTTFISSSNKLTYQNIGTSRAICQNTRRSYHRALLTLDPNFLASLEDLRRGTAVNYHAWYTPKTFDYTNLNHTIPESILMAQAQIDPSCRFLTAVENCKRTDYNPILSVPQEIRDLDPDWKYCDTYFRGFYDPPLALLSVDALSGPTATEAPSHHRTQQFHFQPPRY